MVLAIDIGNTNISLGIFSFGDGKYTRLLKKYTISTKKFRGDYAVSMRRIFRENKINDAVICSVVPDMTKALELILLKLLGKKPVVIGRDIKVPIKNLYHKPGQVGQDRLVNAYYAAIFYGTPVVIIDFGTAVTFDVVSRRKEYLGGMILPGLSMSLNALSENTALLPKVRLNKPKGFIGRDTKNSMLSGIIYGFAGLCDSLIQGLKKKTGKDTKIIGTGGDIQLIRQYCKKIDKIDQDLTLEAINLVYCNRKK